MFVALRLGFADRQIELVVRALTRGIERVALGFTTGLGLLGRLYQDRCIELNTMSCRSSSPMSIY